MGGVNVGPLGLAELACLFQHGQKTHLNVSSLYVSSLIIDGNRRRQNPASLRSLRDDG